MQARLAAQRRATDTANAHKLDFSHYKFRPVAYIREVLHCRTIWKPIEEFISSIHSAPYKFNLRSGHKLGKTWALGALINYWFDCFDPGVVITLGASEEAMQDTVWTEVRMQRRAAGLSDAFAGVSELWSSPVHWAKLYSPRKMESLHGKHRGNVFVIFDEATAIERNHFTVMRGIFKPEPGNLWINCYNPVDPSTPVYQEEQSEEWSTTSLSSLDHPNIVVQRAARKEFRELYSDALPIPNAVSISQVDDWVKAWTQRIDPETALATDFQWQWKDGSTTWHRPQMDWEARCLGSWPSQESSSVWSDALFTTVCNARAAVPIHDIPQVGCDVAGRGEKGDFTAVHSRWGCLSLNHVERRGIRATEIEGLLIETVKSLADLVNKMRVEEKNNRPMITAQEIPIKIDDDMLGGAIYAHLVELGYHCIPIRASTNATDPTRYPNKRSELWFQTADRALHGGVAFSTIGSDGKPYCRLDKESVKRLRLQSVAPRWKLDSIGRRVVEPKEVTKERLGRSPDDMDAANLAYFETGWDVPSSMEIPIFDKPHIGPPSQEQQWNDYHRLDERPKPKRKVFTP